MKSSRSSIEFRIKAEGLYNFIYLYNLEFNVYLNSVPKFALRASAPTPATESIERSPVAAEAMAAKQRNSCDRSDPVLQCSHDLCTLTGSSDEGAKGSEQSEQSEHTANWLCLKMLCTPLYPMVNDHYPY